MDRYDEEKKIYPENNVKTGPEEGSSDDIVETNFTGTPIDQQNKRDEEVASEIGTVNYEDRTNNDVQSQASSITGWIAIALSILSFFMMPIILGGAGIIVGFIARNRDSEWLGNTAIVAGAISILITLFIRPYVY